MRSRVAAYELERPAPAGVQQPTLGSLGTLRLWAACLMLLAGLASLGATIWDVMWHADVGRDTAFTPPHILLYGGVALRGVVALTMVLYETWWWRRKTPRVPEANSVSFLGWFRGSLGFLMAGCGELSSALGAPLDAYWHSLYGIDISVWAPFHVMMITGSGVADLGTAYALAAEANRRSRGSRFAMPQVAPKLARPLVLVALAVALGRALVLAEPAVGGQPVLQHGPVDIASYPLFLAVLLPLFLVAAVECSGWVGAATALGALFTLGRLAMEHAAPWGVAQLVELQGVSYRADVPPHLRDVVPSIVAFPLWIIVAGLLVDATYLAVARFRPRALESGGTLQARLRDELSWLGAGVAGLLSGTASVLLLRQAEWFVLVFASLGARGAPVTESGRPYLAAVVLATVLGAVSGGVGRALGLVLAHSER